MSRVARDYQQHYGGARSRRGLFDALAAWQPSRRVLYPGSFVHVTASFMFPSVTYVDNDRNAKRFFAQRDEVLALAERSKTYPQATELVFHGRNYESELAEPEGSFDLLLSLYAGFVSQSCRRYLAVGGVLAVNNSHADAGLAAIDPGYELIGVVQGRCERLRVVEGGLDAYFRPKQEVEVTAQLLRKLGRGIGYTKVAPFYLFRRTSTE